MGMGSDRRAWGYRRRPPRPSDRFALPPEPTKVQTNDGVELSLTYYPSAASKDPARGKQVTPVVLLHDEKDTQGMFSSLATRLQTAGPNGKQPSFAVVTVDLRGHGVSIRQTAPNGATRELDAAKLNRNDILAMSAQDMEAVRGFLVVKNDAGELNLNKLCLVGVGLGATVAVNWAAQDWDRAAAVGRQTGTGRQGAGARFAATGSIAAIMLQQALRRADLKKQLAWMLIYGEQNPEQATDVKRIYRQLERYPPRAGIGPGTAAKSGVVAVSFGSCREAAAEPGGRADRGEDRRFSDDPRRRPGIALAQAAKSPGLASQLSKLATARVSRLGPAGIRPQQLGPRRRRRMRLAATIRRGPCREGTIGFDGFDALRVGKCRRRIGDAAVGNPQLDADRQHLGVGEHIAVESKDLVIERRIVEIAIRELRERVAVDDDVRSPARGVASASRSRRTYSSAARVRICQTMPGSPAA